MRYVEAIRSSPNAPLHDMQKPVSRDPEEWAGIYSESLKHAAMAEYLQNLAWFYAAERPTNALEKLIESKVGVIPRGETTREFWKMLDRL